MTTTSSTPDTDLLRRMRSGDAAAFAALYRRHQGPLYRFALLRCGASATAADVVQETFMGLMTARFTFDPLRGQLQHFLFGVARNLILKHDSAQWRHLPLPGAGDDDDNAGAEPVDDTTGPLARLLDNEAADEVRRVLTLLAPHYRDVVILYEMHDLTYAQIAAVCQIDIGTVRSRLSRGRAALAKRLASWHGAGAT